MFDKIYDEVKKNLKNPRMYAFILTVIVLFFLLFPYLDANLFYYRRIESRVEILTKVSNIDVEKVSCNPVLYSEYQDILQEIQMQPENTINHIFSKETRSIVNNVKFITGGFVFWILAIMCVFIKEMKCGAFRIVGLSLFSLIGVVFGFVAKSIPNIFNPIVNCIGFPVVIIFIAALILTSSKKISAEI